MIELRNDSLCFSFPEVHPAARLRIEFQRTLRIPDDDKTYPLPPGLGKFPLHHVDDHAAQVSEAWLRHGGVMLPMYQSEALWLRFHAEENKGVDYPFAIKIATGKINAVTGVLWQDGLHTEPQDYMVSPTQLWLDGYCVEKGVIRQFVAMPLGTGYSVEEQVTGEAEHGGLQVSVYPAKAALFEKLLAEAEERRSRIDDAYSSYADMMEPVYQMERRKTSMGLGMGGRMRQEIYTDPYTPDVWQTEVSSRCFVHIANSLVWRELTGANPPTVPFAAKEYARARLPWFDYYKDGAPTLSGSGVLANLKSIATLAKQKWDFSIADNESVDPETVIQLGDKVRPSQVREGTF